MAQAPHFDGATYEPELDQSRLSTLLARVHARMTDGNWHTLADLARTCHGSEASVSARLRDLRKDRFGAHDIRRRRTDTDGLFEYAMLSNKPLADASEPAPSLNWVWGNDRHYIRTEPEAFTVSRSQAPGSKPVYLAWDCRAKLARTAPMAQLIGHFPTQEAARAAAEAIDTEAHR